MTLVIDTQRLGPLLLATTDAAPQALTGGRLGRFRWPVGQVVVAVVGAATAPDAPGAVVRQDGRTAEPAAGALVLWDTTRPHVVDFPSGAWATVCLVPRGVLAVTDDQLVRVTATVVPADGPVASLVWPLLLRLATTAEHCPARVADQLAGNVVDLLATLIVERAEEGDGGAGESRGSWAASGVPRDARTVDIRAFVDRNLGDPGLAPENIAAAHHISVRTLHKLFEAEGVTVARLIQRRRLEECAQDLARGDGSAYGVSEVGRRWGFGNAAHFSRVFRAAYGVPPSAWRGSASGTGR
ncbi:helix-turn-helix domain-containing protein [Streptomyces sp. NPDC090127]|uniref:helix-turn-helix domain-containing protein n=1 Tax=Streptomyces sp. NPDC090127 TaxID=3365953 RepID=UPI003800E034